MEGEETKEEGDWKLSANQGRVKSTGGGAVDRGKTPRRARNPCETASSGGAGEGNPSRARGVKTKKNNPKWESEPSSRSIVRRVLGLTMKNPGWGRLERPEKTPDRTKQTTNGCIG